MATWVLTCKNCNADFTHSAIADDYTVSAFLWPRKPEFPEEGSPVECPSCGKQATYQQTHLTYRA